jgi:hypothetical protein
VNVPQGGIIELVALPSDPYVCSAPVVWWDRYIYICGNPILNRPYPILPAISGM